MTSLTVTLSHDEWQWVMSLVLNSQYLRARPIVDKVEAAVAQQKAAGKVAQDELYQQANTDAQQIAGLKSDLRQRNAEIARLEKRLEKRAKKQAANGHDGERIVVLEKARAEAEKRADHAQEMLASRRQSEREKIASATRDLERQLTELRAQLARAQDLGYQTESLEKLGLVPPTPPGVMSEADLINRVAQASAAERAASDA